MNKTIALLSLTFVGVSLALSQELPHYRVTQLPSTLTRISPHGSSFYETSSSLDVVRSNGVHESIPWLGRPAYGSSSEDWVVQSSVTFGSTGQAIYTHSLWSESGTVSVNLPPNSVISQVGDGEAFAGYTNHYSYYSDFGVWNNGAFTRVAQTVWYSDMNGWHFTDVWGASGIRGDYIAVRVHADGMRPADPRYDQSLTVNVRTGYTATLFNGNVLDVNSSGNAITHYGYVYDETGGVIRDLRAIFSPYKIADSGDILGNGAQGFGWLRPDNTTVSLRSLITQGISNPTVTDIRSLSDNGQIIANGFGNTLYLFDPVPEPSGAVILGVGALCWFGRRKRG